jgi:hypothetical protein
MQKMEGKKTTDSFKEFNPLFILRYSATHKTEHNKVHRLDALEPGAVHVAGAVDQIGLGADRARDLDQAVRQSDDRLAAWIGRQGGAVTPRDVLTGCRWIETADEAEAAWRIVDPIIDAWVAGAEPEMPNYTSGTWGPEAADELLTREGRRWRRL